MRAVSYRGDAVAFVGQGEVAEPGRAVRVTMLGDPALVLDWLMSLGDRVISARSPPLPCWVGGSQAAG
jgi:hypothetical protein